ncbi:nicotinate-nucleotide--dimethylbenzimidazole phosphoribosyltransferase [Paenibacillus sp. FSL H7-0357]|uniref:nicotinate-nucleotide--dimethylbenzimidazole phosphoribosyltransferase n=1 Tax=Paenibacillus sp. FSL H7-0357 TaxID=1536774 RepID=UPI0004F87BF3|nr:nicotinate-nucleotide--dimethylbenzimidazole phosphoribosyltransferase [Paenibacillus sp. FSL H7-0357]AIQ16435.1 nicotinate-nucleotide--dimethylbenzimidazole phosphoribosyltransferase [Paenibacillus sp. FSL H7-0357]
MISALEEVIGRIVPADEQAILRAEDRLNSLTKPPGSLGRLEALAVRLAGISGVEQPSYGKRTVVVMAADHGVCSEGVSAFPQEVTVQMAHNFLSGGAAVNVLARQGGAEVKLVDIGIGGDLSHPELIDRKVRRGTCNMAQGPAMSREEALRAILAGVSVAEEAVKSGTEILITGEMGIGNTTASAAVLCALEGIPAETAVGRGTGIDDERLRHKIAVVERALQINAPDTDDAIDVLAKVGGLEIAGLAGLILGAAAARVPVVLDGFISGAAALAAKALAPESIHYMIASHVSGEQGHKLMLERLGLEALLDLGLRLGEGTGGALCLHLIEAVCRIMREMATFESAGVSGAENR